jgi:hypothetical protein
MTRSSALALYISKLSDRFTASTVLGWRSILRTQGFGSVIWTVTANAVRLLTSTGCALVAIYWLDLGTIGFFVGIAGAFCAYAALTSAAIFKVKEPTPR